MARLVLLGLLVIALSARSQSPAVEGRLRFTHPLADRPDTAKLLRINALSGHPVPACLVRPSQDLGALAKDHVGDVPFHLRQLLRSTASPEELGDLLSYLMFSHGYLKTLLELGYEDTAQYRDSIKDFLAAPPSSQRRQG